MTAHLFLLRSQGAVRGDALARQWANYNSGPFSRSAALPLRRFPDIPPVQIFR